MSDHERFARLADELESMHGEVAEMLGEDPEDEASEVEKVREAVNDYCEKLRVWREHHAPGTHRMSDANRAKVAAIIEELEAMAADITGC